MFGGDDEVAGLFGGGKGLDAVFYRQHGPSAGKTKHFEPELAGKSKFSSIS